MLIVVEVFEDLVEDLLEAGALVLNRISVALLREQHHYAHQVEEA